MKYDYLIVGSGFFGSICAYELNRAGFKVVVIDSRNHIGGNCHTENREGINIHTYGPHIFHTSNDEVWKWINQFVSFNNFMTRDTIESTIAFFVVLPCARFTVGYLNLSPPFESE